MKPAFSSVACPEWTLTRVAEAAGRWGFLGVELRTFGYGSTSFTCDPALTGAEKVRGMFSHAGVQIASLGSSVRFDDAVTPPVIGHVITDTERSVREGKGIVDLAVTLECPLIRVFGFEIVGNERRKAVVSRIAERLRKVCDHADKSGVGVMIENGGSFATSAQIAEIIDVVQHPLLHAAYSAPVGAAAGETVSAAANVLGDRLVCVKIKDMQKGVPCKLGEGELGAADAVAQLARAGFAGWLVYEFDRAWLPGANHDLDAIMQHAAKTMFGWVGARRSPMSSAQRVS